VITTNAEIHVEKEISKSLFLISVTLQRYKQWVPGMFMQISLKERTASEPWLDGHSFSFASWGSEKALILVRKEGAFTTELVRKSMDSFSTSVRYPFGDFMLNSGKNKVFIAGGAGISVFLSYIDYINLAQNSSDSVSLFHAAKRESESVRNIYSKNIPNNVSIMQYTTNMDETSYTGRPTIDDLRNAISDLSEKDYFICGPLGFNAYWRSQLKNLGISPKEEQWENMVNEK
jgi:nitric oxide dioxygenase